jgi:hypothetical protein
VEEGFDEAAPALEHAPDGTPGGSIVPSVPWPLNGNAQVDEHLVGLPQPAADLSRDVFHVSTSSVDVCRLGGGSVGKTCDVESSESAHTVCVAIWSIPETARLLAHPSNGVTTVRQSLVVSYVAVTPDGEAKRGQGQ